MTRKQWKSIGVMNFIVFMFVFGLCVRNGWEKTALLMVFPLALATGIIVSVKKKNSI